jgi:type II restriction enzyme
VSTEPDQAQLGRWDEYLAMRERILRINAEHRDLLSNDLGCVAGLLFDVGSGRYPVPPEAPDPTAEAAWRADLEQVRQEVARTAARGAEGERTHAEVQGWLRDLGGALGYDVWIAANDRSRALGAGRLGDGCLERLPAALSDRPGADAIRLIDVLWLERRAPRVVAAFEVEHTTSIHSGIMRMLDLASIQGDPVRGLYLVAPDDREREVKAQLTRPAFRDIARLQVRYLPYGELERNREAIARFGEGLKAVDAIARRLA